MGVANLAIGAAFALLGRAAARARRPDAAARRRRCVRARMFAVYGAAALLVGFAMMVLQTTVIRIGGLSFGSVRVHVHDGRRGVRAVHRARQRAVSAFARIGRSALPAALWILATAVHRALLRARDGARTGRTCCAWCSATSTSRSIRSTRRCSARSLLAIGPAVVFSGAVLPLLFHALRRELGDLGAQAGRLYSVNTVGSLRRRADRRLCAAVLARPAPRLPDRAVRARARGGDRHAARSSRAIRFAGAARAAARDARRDASLPAWRPRYLMAGMFRKRQPDGVDASTGRRRCARYERQRLRRSTTTIPNTSVAHPGDRARGERASAQHPRERKVGRQLARRLLRRSRCRAVAGAVRRARRARVRDRLRNRRLGGELAQLEETRSVTVAEISSGVIAAAPLFDFANHAVSRNPKVRIVHSDAYRALRQEPAAATT